MLDGRRGRGGTLVETQDRAGGVGTESHKIKEER